MPLAFDAFAERFANTIAAPWAKTAVRSTPVDVTAYDVLFRQVGFQLPVSVRAELSERGAFELLALSDPPGEEDEGRTREALDSLRGPGWAGRNALAGGLRWLSPSDLFETSRTQRHAASAMAELGSLWVVIAPRRSLSVDAFALDGRKGHPPGTLVPFHEDSIHEEFDFLAPDGSFRHARPSLESWAEWLTEQMVAAVRALERAGLEPLGPSAAPSEPKRVDLTPMLEQVKAGKRWSSWVSAVWREALRRGSVETAREVLEHVGTLDTTSSEPTYKLPAAEDVFHRLPRSGPFSRRAALLEVWRDRTPAGAANAVAFDLLLSLADSDEVAPLHAFDALYDAAWADRGPAMRDETRWARALGWALGPTEPPQLAEAALLPLEGHGPREAALKAWLHLTDFARRAGVL